MKYFQQSRSSLILGLAFTFALSIACVEGDDDDQAAALLAVAALAQQTTSTTTGCGGKSYCYLFQTAGTAANNIGISGKDAVCNSDGNKPAGSGTFKAMIADGTNRIACTSANCGGGLEGTDWVLAASTEYRRGDGTTVIGTTATSGVFTFPLTNSIGTTVTNFPTGLEGDWTTSTNDCTNWSSISGIVDTRAGRLNETGTGAIAANVQACSVTLGVYCAEQ